LRGSNEHREEVVLVAVLTDDDVKPKSGVGAGMVLDADEPEVVPEKEAGRELTHILGRRRGVVTL
jgi:hypothetical protein